MPIQKGTPITTPEFVTPETVYDKLWIRNIMIHWPHNEPGSFLRMESVPMAADGSHVLNRTPEGADTAEGLQCSDIPTWMARCPELVTAMPYVIAACEALYKLTKEDEAAAEAAAAAALGAVSVDATTAADQSTAAATNARIAAQNTQT